MEEFAKYDGVYAEWAPNEKVAVEVAIGAALGGAKALAVMKHVGVNVAADPIFTVSYTGIEGALVIISADDPSMHSSQNEQDNRNYAKFAKIPMIEPADPQEAKDFIKLAFEISEQFDTPVFFRTTTRVAHSKSVVTLKDPQGPQEKTGLVHHAEKYVMVPINARIRRVEVEKRQEALKKFVENFPENKMEINNPEVGIITAGMPYNYAKEVFPDFSYLKLGMVYPLPVKLIHEFASKVKKIYVIEELDPYLEEQIKAMGIEVTGKDIFPYTNEFDPGIVKKAINADRHGAVSPYQESLAQRPPNLCPGCPHRGLFYALKKSKAYVHGDIGCYTLSYLKPLEGLHSCICMGASIGMAHGMSKALKEKGKGKVVGVIGDSTFLHSGITSLLNMAYNNSDALIIILDNSTTAMTGMQEHPGTGYTLMGKEAKKVNLNVLISALGIENIRVINPYNIKETQIAIKDELANSGPSVIISQSPCVLFKRANLKPVGALKIDPDKCEGCKTCLTLNCPPIAWKAGVTKEGSKRKGIAVIDETLCNGCGLCAQICKFGAIS
jgi:indolepyruvate ferredoxin oxidoreductase alpha subunit